MHILDFWICRIGAGTMKNAPTEAKLTLSDAVLPALERPGRAKAVTRGAREYSGFSDMSVLCGNREKCTN